MGNFHLINLKSGEKGKVPAADLLHYGELAVNYAEGGETIFLKNSKDAIVEIKPHAVVADELSKKQDKTDNALATTDKTVTGAINEISTKVSNLTGVFVWKGKFDTLPAVTDYEAGNVVGVGNKEYVLTVTENTKTWEELGDEGSYLLKSTAEETYAKKTDIPTVPEVNNPKVSVKMNGTEKGSFTLNQATDEEVDLGTVITAHQDISGKVDKTLNAKSLESINILSSNSDRDKAANKAAIKAYIDNLTALGVDTTKYFNIPVYINYYGYGCLTACRYGGDYTYIYLIGILFKPETGGDDSRSTIVKVSYNTGEVIVIQSIYNDETLATTNKSLVGAINEVNTLAKSKGNGTITEVKMNGVSKGTSGVVDLGTVLTEHQSLKTINGKTITGSGNIEISAPSITVDTSMSDTSTNPVQNKVIKAYIDGLLGNVAAQLSQI